MRSSADVAFGEGKVHKNFNFNILLIVLAVLYFGVKLI